MLRIEAFYNMFLCLKAQAGPADGTTTQSGGDEQTVKTDSGAAASGANQQPDGSPLGIVDAAFNSQLGEIPAQATLCEPTLPDTPVLEDLQNTHVLGVHCGDLFVSRFCLTVQAK